MITNPESSVFLSTEVNSLPISTHPTILKQINTFNPRIAQKSPISREDVFSHYYIPMFRFSNLESAENNLQTLSINKKKIILNKLTQIKERQYEAVLFKNGIFMSELEEGKQDSLCNLFVFVADGLEVSVYFALVQVVESKDESLSTEDNHEKSLKDKDRNYPKPTNSKPSSSRASRNFPIRDDFERMNLTVTSFNLQSNNGFGSYENQPVFFKVERVSLENEKVMNLMSNISSNNLCQIVKYCKIPGKEDHCLTICEKLISLKDVIKEIPREIRPQFALGCLIDMLSGLEMLHDHTIIHCDISFENVMFRNVQNQYFAVLIDFNNSRDATESTYNQNVKFKEGYTPSHDDDMRFTKEHDIYGAALTFCRIIKEIMILGKIDGYLGGERNFKSDCQVILDYCKQTSKLIKKIAPIIEEMMKGEFSNVRQIITKLEKFQFEYQDD